jgi:hypothetical protein
VMERRESLLPQRAVANAASGTSRAEAPKPGRKDVPKVALVEAPPAAPPATRSRHETVSATTVATPPGTSTPAPAHVEPSPVEFATPLSHDEERIDACYDGEPLWYRTMEDLLGDQPVPGLVPHDLEG